MIAGVLLGVLNRSGIRPYGHRGSQCGCCGLPSSLILTLISGLLFGMIPARNVGRAVRCRR